MVISAQTSPDVLRLWPELEDVDTSDESWYTTERRDKASKTALAAVSRETSFFMLIESESECDQVWTLTQFFSVSFL